MRPSAVSFGLRWFPCSNDIPGVDGMHPSLVEMLEKLRRSPLLETYQRHNTSLLVRPCYVIERLVHSHASQAYLPRTDSSDIDGTCWSATYMPLFLTASAMGYRQQRCQQTR